MGLCKCPKRKVTNQFCFEHRVNVCEHCMVKKHPNCVVQSYLQWLQDSDYDPNCGLCRKDLSEESCARLACFHVFHWVCLDRHLGNLPSDTAPAGYACPTCQECVFPPDKLVSPVADALRKLLSDVNWARAGLGLPLLEDAAEKRPAFSSGGGGAPSGPRPNPEGDSGGGSATRGLSSSVETDESQQAVIHLPTSRSSVSGSAASFLSSAQAEERDEDKYRRTSVTRFLSRWWRTAMLRTRRIPKTQAVIFKMAFVFFVFVAVVLILSHMWKRPGSSDFADYDDPMLNPMNNPNIRVNDG